MNSVWKGAISFGLVTIPVQLYSATEERRVSLREVHAQDGGRIRYRRVCTVDGDEVSYDDIVKGYELPNGDIVVLSEQDLAGLPLSTSRVIEVLSFVDADRVDPIRLSRSYFCEPIGSGAAPYGLLAEAMRRTGKIALAKIALRQRESLAMLRARDGLLLLHILLRPDEVRDPHFPFQDDEVPLGARELQAAQRYIETLTGDLGPEEGVDRYREALERLVEAKIEGLELARPQAPAANAAGRGDLLETLRRSVEEAKRRRAEDAAGHRGNERLGQASAEQGPQRKGSRDRSTATRRRSEESARDGSSD